MPCSSKSAYILTQRLHVQTGRLHEKYTGSDASNLQFCEMIS
jgi:hypothetical protein